MGAATSPERDYDGAYYAARESWGDRRRESMRAVAALRDIPAPLVLDIGCGSGPLLPLLRRRGFIPLGLEVNEAAVAAARHLGNVVRVGPTVDLPLRDAPATWLTPTGAARLAARVGQVPVGGHSAVSGHSAVTEQES